MKFEVSHRTTYHYRRTVVQSRHIMHLEPRSTARQSLSSHSLLIEPAPATQLRVSDYFGNAALLISIEDEHTSFNVHARSTVEILPASRIDPSTTVAWEEVAARARQADGRLDTDVLQFVCRSRLVPLSSASKAFAQRFFPPHRPVLEGVLELTRHIFETFSFDSTATDVSTPVEKVLGMRRGVCQDFSHATISALRSLGIPARYVSGYLLTRPPPGQPKLKGADASHAWLSVWAPETGWVDFDPTNGLMPSAEHITVAWGRDYDDICPIGGVLLGGGDQKMSIAVDVEPASERHDTRPAGPE